MTHWSTTQPFFKAIGLVGLPGGLFAAASMRFHDATPLVPIQGKPVFFSSLAGFRFKKKLTRLAHQQQQQTRQRGSHRASS
jgi:hypothetical protein